jgi:hypothetical protein
MPVGIYQRTEKRHVKHAAPSNPNWSGGPQYAIPYQLQEKRTATQFEEFVSALGVPEQFWPNDRRIARWVHVHKNHRYVPEFLLKALGESVLDDGDAL